LLIFDNPLQQYYLDWIAVYFLSGNGSLFGSFSDEPLPRGGKVMASFPVLEQ
jgi:hypothetical protein